MSDVAGQKAEMRQVMGNEAIALGALAAGVNVVAGYPGTPSSEIIECISKYNRETGVGFRDAFGTIDPAVFSTSYPLNCDRYYGAAEGQNEFMEESRVGLCDLIACLKGFVSVENMDCGFSAFEFVNF